MRHSVMHIGLLVALLAVASGCKPEESADTGGLTPSAKPAPSAQPAAKTVAAPEAPAEAAPSGDAVAGPIKWETDLDAGLARAEAEGKPVMVDFYADWCSWCKKLDEETYTDAEVQKVAAGFVCVKVDTEAQPAVAEKYGVEGLPTIVFLASDGKEIHRKSGYAPPGEFIREIEEGLGS